MIKDILKVLGNRTYTIYEDSGHAWIKVPVLELFALQIAGDISSHSYIYRNHAYLEEDCDLTTFFNAYHAVKGRDPKFRAVYSRSSTVREYPKYTVEKAHKELP
jgi:hypothetical protein